MKKFVTLLLALGSLLLCSSSGSAEGSKGKGLAFPGLNQKLESPDHRYVLWVGERNKSFYYHILDKTTSQIADSLDMPTTVSAHYWTGDSKSIISVILLSGGPQAYIIRMDDAGTWRGTEVNKPPFGDKRSALLNCEPGKSTVKLTYSLLPHQSLNADRAWFKCTFDYDPKTQTSSNLTSGPLGEVEFGRMKRKYFL